MIEYIFGVDFHQVVKQLNTCVDLNELSTEKREEMVFVDEV